jgi:type I restriction-modification system DNA methylase subunit
MQQTEAEFLKDLDKQLWTAADRLRSNLDAAVYKHVVLGLIFLKYVSDAFEERRVELEQQFRDPIHDYYLGDDSLIVEELEARDYYTEKNVFWVPALASSCPARLRGGRVSILCSALGAARKTRCLPIFSEMMRRLDGSDSTR